MSLKTILVVGLGNPGSEYLLTRHNIGFLVVDEFAKHHNLNSFYNKFKSFYTQATINGYKVILLKPLTYMNKSGLAVAEALKFFKLELSNLIVIHDDLELLPFKLKYKIGGGNAGHNGLKSIDQYCGADYARLRIGIGRPVNKENVASYVLHKFNKEEQNELPNLLYNISSNLSLLFTNNANEFFNNINKKGTI